MADQPLAPPVWEALRQLAYQDGERVTLTHTAHERRARAAGDAGLEAARARLDAAHQALAQAGADRRARESEIEDLQLRVKRTNDRLASGKLASEREIAAAQTELARLQGAIADAEVAWFEASDREEASKRALPEEQAAFQVEEREAAARMAAAAREAAAAEARLADIDRLRREAAQAIPVDVRDRYRALYKPTGGRPFAQVEAGDCSHCRNPVPAAAVQALRAHTGVPTCPRCGRLLLLP